MAEKVNQYAALEKLFENYQPKTFAAAEDAGWLPKMGSKLYNTGGMKARIMNEMKLMPEEAWTPEVIQTIQNSMKAGAENPFSFKPNRKTTYTLKDGTEKVFNTRPIQDTLGILGNNIKAHPWQFAGTGLNAAGNIAGLVDNDKFLGQALGTVGGALAGKLGFKFGPLGVANMAMGAGNLGALFDVLHSKKEQEEQYQQQYC